MSNVLLGLLAAAALGAVKPSFVASFDETSSEPRVPGLHGQALYVGAKTEVPPSHSCGENFNPLEGTVSFWYKPDAPKNDDPPRKVLFQTKYSGDRSGSGAVMVWFANGYLRGDVSDDSDAYVAAPANYLAPDRWHHIAFSWNAVRSTLYVDGRAFGQRRGDSASPLACAYGVVRKGRKGHAIGQPYVFSNRQKPTSFFLGSDGEKWRMCGAMDDFRLWRTELDGASVRSLYAAERGANVGSLETPPDYAAMMRDHVNPHTASSLPRAGVPGEMELVTEWKPGATVPRDGDAFRAIGTCRLGKLKDVPYLEADGEKHARFALRFRIDPTAALHCFEIDYPDDRARTCDIVIQSSKDPLPGVGRSGNNIMQVGYLTGDEYPNTGRTLTHRCLYWTTSEDVTLIAMTARQDKPAAVSAVRVYRVVGGRLPVTKIAEPPANDGWRRTFGLYYEDPAVEYDFARPWGDREQAMDLLDRLTATMKYTGQNVFCYPAVWYQGEIGLDYMPRQHPPYYREAIYAAFDREGLRAIPTMNPNEIEIPEGLITPTSVKDGSLHPSPVAILATGEPNPGGWHSTPPNYNVTHPEVRRQVLAWVDRLIAEGRNHPSFGGVCLHVTRHSPLWFGDDQAGYNDYTVEQFARETGRTIPASIDRSAPLRGKAYADWLTNDCAVAWTEWRCQKVAAFWKEIAARLAAARGDLKLMVNLFLAVMPRHPGFARADSVAWSCREAGFDAKLFADVPNFSTAEVVIPADARWMEDHRYRRGNEKPGKAELKALKARQSIKYLNAEDFSILEGSAYPWVNQHDRYWESPVGNKKRSKQTLNCDWLAETTWRVTTINPGGRAALRQYAVPLRFQDILAMSKGGFLIGTYGSEEVLSPWMQAFRALPAVKMATFFQKDDVVARRAVFRDRTYAYVVNTGDRETDVSVPGLEGFTDLVSGEKALPTLSLKSYELRAFIK